MSLIIRGIKINTGETFQKKAVLGIEKIKNQFILKNFDVLISPFNVMSLSIVTLKRKEFTNNLENPPVIIILKDFLVSL